MSLVIRTPCTIHILNRENVSFGKYVKISPKKCFSSKVLCTKFNRKNNWKDQRIRTSGVNGKCYLELIMRGYKYK